MMKMIEVYVENRLYSDNNIELNTITAGEAVEV
jgi:hypothetical protein